jgi:hypothetical protein
MPDDFSNELCKWGLECEYAKNIILSIYEKLRHPSPEVRPYPSAESQPARFFVQPKFRSNDYLCVSLQVCLFSNELQLG